MPVRVRFPSEAREQLSQATERAVFIDLLQICSEGIEHKYKIMTAAYSIGDKNIRSFRIRCSRSLTSYQLLEIMQNFQHSPVAAQFLPASGQVQNHLNQSTYLNLQDRLQS